MKHTRPCTICNTPHSRGNGKYCLNCYTLMQKEIKRISKAAYSMALEYVKNLKNNSKS
jgi:hypothetical protein